MWPHGRRPRWGGRSMTTVLIVLPLAVGGCTGPANSSAKPSAAVERIGEHIGEAVTVYAGVVRVITPQSFVLDAGDYGDGTLLVVTSRAMPQLSKRHKVNVTGRVFEFHHGRYRTEFALPGATAYRQFEGEAFLIGDSVGVTVG